MKIYGKFSDQDLLALLKDGDHAAFGEIHKRYYPLLYSHAFKRLPDREEVKDILQELFAFLWNNRDNLIFNSLSAYLYTSVRNRVINVFSRDKIRQQYAGSLAAYAETGENLTESHLREKELIALIEKEVAALPGQMRRVFELSRFEHLSHNEIAEMMNTSPLTVRKQIQNALRVLRCKLSSAIFSIIY